MKTLKYTIIIPTRNRLSLLLGLLKQLNEILPNDSEVIVVDSSDVNSKLYLTKNNYKLKYIHTKIKSAAVQRNIGLNQSSKKSEFTFFLDDDTLPPAHYFEDISNTIIQNNAVGVSGLAINPYSKYLRRKPTGVRGLIYRFFLLDSQEDGKLLKSAINIPCRDYYGEPIKTDWLIGCSGWKTQAIGETRFESDFYGASIAEDVIFSLRMKQKGILIVNPKIILDHYEEERGRPDDQEFWKMWMVNRFRVIKILDLSKYQHFFFWWASLGQLFIFLVSSILHSNGKQKSMLGIYRGAREIIGLKNEN